MLTTGLSTTIQIVIALSALFVGAAVEETPDAVKTILLEVMREAIELAQDAGATDPSGQVQLLAEVANAHATWGELGSVRAAVSHFNSSSFPRVDPEELDSVRREALVDAVEILASRGDARGAVSLVEDEVDRDGILDQAAGYFMIPDVVSVSEIQAAVILSEGIHDDFDRQSNLALACWRQLDLGDTNGAASTWKQLAGSERYEGYGSRLATEQARQGDFGAAERTLSTLDDPLWRATGEVGIAQGRARHGDRKAAHSTIEKAIRMAESLSKERRGAFIEVLLTGCDDFESPGDSMWILDHADRMIETLTDHRARAGALAHVAGERSRVGDITGEAVALSSSLKTAVAIDDLDRSVALREMAKRFARSGSVNGIQQILEAISEGQAKSGIVRDVAAQLAERRQVPDAVAISQTIIEADLRDQSIYEIVLIAIRLGDLESGAGAARTQTGSPWGAVAFTELAVAYGDAGEPDKAKALLNEAVSIACEQDDETAYEIVGRIALDAKNLGNAAGDGLRQAWRRVESIEPVDIREVARLAIGLGEIGDLDLANSILMRAADSCIAVEDESEQSYYAHMVAEAFTRIGEVEAARTFADRTNSRLVRAHALLGICEGLVDVASQ